jgi:hypothetical protein
MDDASSQRSNRSSPLVLGMDGAAPRQAKQRDGGDQLRAQGQEQRRRAGKDINANAARQCWQGLPQE